MVLALLLVASSLLFHAQSRLDLSLQLHGLRRIVSSNSPSSPSGDPSGDDLGSGLAIEDPNPTDGYSCNFEMFEAMGVCNTLDYKSCCTSVKTALYGGCLCTTVFQDYIRYCIQVTRELNEYLDDNCVPDHSKIDQVLCYHNLTYHERHDPAVYSICPLVSLTPSSSPDPDDRVSPWQWFWNTSGTLPPPPGDGSSSSPTGGNPPPPGDEGGHGQVMGQTEDPLSDTGRPPAASSSSLLAPAPRVLLLVVCVVAL